MKVLIEVIIICLLIILGWRQPFSEHLRRIVSPEKAAEWGIPSQVSPPAERRAAPAATPSAPRDSSWMWRRKTLDSHE